MLILVGPTISVWGPRLTAPVRWVIQRRALRRLQPLWRALTTAIPQIERRSPVRGGAVGYRLYRCVIEICDGLLILEPYRNTRPGHGDGAVTRADAVVRAEEIASALRAFSVSQGGGDPAAEGHHTGGRGALAPNAEIAPGVPVMKDEVAELVRLSRAFARLERTM